MKKAILCTDIIMLMVLTTSSVGFCKCEEREDWQGQQEISGEQMAVEYKGIKTAVWNEALFPGDTVESNGNYQATENRGVLFHNQGMPMKNTLFAEGNTGENSLIAVYRSVRDGVPCESYYFTNYPENDLQELTAYVEKDQEEKQLQEILLSQKQQALMRNLPDTISRAKKTIVKKEYNWDMKLHSSGISVGKLSTKVNFERDSVSATVNDKKASVWYITSESTLEKSQTGTLLGGYETKFRFDATGESLSQHSPMGNRSGGTVSVGFAGFVPSVNYTFDVDGFKVTDDTSLYSNYARWIYTRKVTSSPSKMHTATGSCVSNTTGDMVTRLSHICDMTYANFRDDYNTGELYIALPDR